MPELPEVETMCRGVLTVVGHRISDVRAGDCALRPISISPPLDKLVKELKGRSIDAVERIGKRVAFRLSDSQTLVIEPRMTGLVLLADPPNKTHLRLKMRLSGGIHRQLLFWDRRGLGTVRLHSPDSLAELKGRLGPDALTVTVAELRNALGSSSRAIKVALLDQDRIAGIGNLYAAEVLFLAKIDPQTPANNLNLAHWKRLQSAISVILHEAIAHEGSTLSDGTYRNALNQVGDYQNHHQVYNRAGEPCPRCRNSTILRIVQSGRSTFYCPRCQRLVGEL